jgi:NAD(P)-dependent dehydrogenase (short-subunit alcohol dehydrogenase family)
MLVENKGSVVNVSSVHAVATSENIAVYAASKGSLSALTRAMALEYGKVGVRVNAVCPGAVDTGMLRAGLMRDNFTNENATVQQRLENLGRKQCIGRVGEPEEIGELILFLADGNKSGYITGENIVIDGGATVKLSTE